LTTTSRPATKIVVKIKGSKAVQFVHQASNVSKALEISIIFFSPKRKTIKKAGSF
jgi:hypothetical protein